MEADAGRGASIREVMDEHRDAWMGRPEVTGMGIGRCEGEPCIVLYLVRRTEEAVQALPESVGGYRVRLEVTGPFRAQPPGDTAEDGG